MATEKLIVELDAKTKKLDAKLQATERKLDRLDGSVKKNDKGFSAMGQSAKTLAGGLAKVATVAVAVGAAISAMVLVSANNRRELEILSRQAKTTTGDFQALAFATKAYGINADQIADSSKDISDKVGEFSAAGTGAFQDYADVMKLAAGEARKVAQEFEGMSSQQILGEMVSKMESAGVSGDKMIFVLESMGSDLSRLLPLFANNSKELLKLKAGFNDVNDQMQITAGQAADLQKVSAKYDLMTSSIGKATTAISATLAPVMDEFFNDIIEVVPTATQAIVNFINTFMKAEDIQSISAIGEQMKMTSASVARLEEDQRRLSETTLNGKNSSMAQNIALSNNAESLKLAKERAAELEAQLIKLQEQQDKNALKDAERLEGKKIGGSTGEDTQDDSGIGTGDQLSAIEDRFKTETELLTEKYELEQEMLGEHHANLLDLEEEYFQALIDIDDRKEQATAKNTAKVEKDKQKNLQKRVKMEQQIEMQNVKSIIGIMSGLVDSDSKVGKALFVGSQALAMAETYVNTQAAAMKAMTIDPTGVLAAKVHAQGALSMVAIGAATLGGLAGGSSSGGGSVGSISAPTPEPQSVKDFEQETARLEVSDSTSDGSAVQTINFATDSGDDLIDAIAAALNKAQTEGRA